MAIIPARRLDMNWWQLCIVILTTSVAIAIVIGAVGDYRKKLK